MKYASRVAMALVTFLLGTGAVLLSSWAWNHSAKPLKDVPVQPEYVKGEITFRFVECVGDHSVFLLQNGTEHPIYARVYTENFWEEFKDANMAYGVHDIQYRASGSSDFKDASQMFDVVPRFRPIMPDQTIRYGVDLWKGPGEYRVSVPYMEDPEVAWRLDHDFESIIKKEFDRVKASWKEASSDIVPQMCR